MLFCIYVYRQNKLRVGVAMKKKYKILIISDVEILFDYPISIIKEKFKDVDFIISAGDLSNTYLDYLFTTLNKEIFY